LTIEQLEAVLKQLEAVLIIAVSLMKILVEAISNDRVFQEPMHAFALFLDKL